MITEKEKIYKRLSVAILDYQCRYRIADDEISAYFSFSYNITCDYRAKHISKYDQVKSTTKVILNLQPFLCNMFDFHIFFVKLQKNLASNDSLLKVFFFVPFF